MKPLDALPWIAQLRRQDQAHKGQAGKVLLIGGAPSMAGALVLAGQAALYSGAGWVQLMMLDEASAHVVATHPELMVHRVASKNPVDAFADIKPDVVAIGPGLGTSALALHWLGMAPLVLDADALNLLSMNAHVLQALMELTNSVVVLKGHHSLVGSAHHESRTCLAGNPGMAVGGTGDVLTGCIAALLAQGLHHQLDVWQSTCVAVQVHSMAGDELLASGTGPVGMTASELAMQIRTVINDHLV